MLKDHDICVLVSEGNSVPLSLSDSFYFGPFVVNVSAREALLTLGLQSTKLRKK